MSPVIDEIDGMSFEYIPRMEFVRGGKYSTGPDGGNLKIYIIIFVLGMQNKTYSLSE